jgi:hypothetical protein
MFADEEVTMPVSGYSGFVESAPKPILFFLTRRRDVILQIDWEPLLLRLYFVRARKICLLSTKRIIYTDEKRNQSPTEDQKNSSF